MDSSLLKHYHDEEYDARLLAETYFSVTSVTVEDLQDFFLRTLYQIFSSGEVTGKTLIDITASSAIHHLLPASEVFQEIIVAESNESAKRGLEKWLNKEQDAFDWSHTSKLFCQLEGKSMMWQEKEEQLRKAIKRILICDFTKENPLHPVILPKVDCLSTGTYLEVISKDLDAYRSNLKKVSSLIKVGGHLILFLFISMSYYTIGEHKFYYLKCDEEFVRKALTDTGFVIKSVDLQPRKKDTHLLDYEHVGFFCAQKERDV
ncbi:indolethylamine N-methyltransferase-like [Ascaphus truei]|uniref:indolethylamine N-methyltransferase-like n=1 Tax=Ascaphus truei TaxID=8439 RepID=UPI003F59EAF7